MEGEVKYEENRSKAANYIYHQEDTNLSFAKHLHNSFEILYVRRGLLEADIDGRKFTVSQGETLVIFPNQIHSYKSQGESVSSLIIFSVDLVPHFFRYISGKRYANPVVKLDSLSLMNGIQKENNPYFNKGCAYQLLGLIDDKCELEDCYDEKSGVLAEIHKYVTLHYTQSLTLKELAKKLGYSYNYLSGLFNGKTAVSFPRFVNFYRVEQASFLLSTTAEKITDIALECGFNNVRSFNREFNSIEHLTPSEYRKNLGRKSS